MLNFILLILEIFVIGFILLSMHFMRKQVGLGTLYVFVGSLQFIQTLLVSSVYDNEFLNFRFSPGSTIFYTSTLFSILLFFHYEGVKKTRGLIYGILISNVTVTLFSHFLLIHAENDSASNSVFLEELLSFELSLFLVGTSLMYLEALLIVFLYQFLNLKFPKKGQFLKILFTMSIVCFIDSVLFYSFFYFNKDNFQELMLGNIVGKQITTLLLSFLFWVYFKYNKSKKMKEEPKSFKDTFKIFTF